MRCWLERNAVEGPGPAVPECSVFGQPPVARLVQPAGSSHRFAASSQANFRPLSCTSNEDLLVCLIRGKSWKRQPQTGQDFPRGVLVPFEPGVGSGGVPPASGRELSTAVDFSAQD